MKYTTTKSELKRYKNMTNADRKAEAVRQGYHEGPIRRTRIVLNTIETIETNETNETSETPARNETETIEQENGDLQNAVDVALQTEEAEYDLLFPEDNAEIGQITEEGLRLKPKKHRAIGELSTSQALSVSGKISTIIISETSSLSISPQILTQVSKDEENRPNLQVRPNSSLSGIPLSSVEGSSECQECKRRLNSPTRKISIESSFSTRSNSRKNAIKSSSVPEDTNYVNSSRLINQNITEAGSEVQSIYSYPPSTIKKITDILNTVPESKSKDVKKKPGRYGNSPNRTSKKQVNSRAKEEEDSLRDSIQQSIDDMIIKEVIRQQTALVEVNRKIKSKKDELKDLESQITSRSQQLKKLVYRVDSATPEDSKSDKPDTRLSIFDKYAVTSSKSNPKLSDSNSKSELGKDSVSDSIIKLEPVSNSTVSKSDSITNTIIESKHKTELSKVSLSDSISEINTELSPDSINFARKLTKRFELSDVVPELDKSVNFLNLMPRGSDAKAWRAGFNVGYEQGKQEAHKDDADLGFEKGFAQGYKKGISERGIDCLPNKPVKSMTHGDFKKINMCKRIEETEENSDSEEPRTSRTQLESSSASFGSQDKVSKRQNSTRISGFNFRAYSVIRKSKPAKKIMNAFLTKKRSAIYNYASIGRNMLFRLISSIYQTAVARVASGEYFESLIDLLYEDILNKYGFKNVADRKYKEFIASAIFHSEHLRVKILIKLIGIGYAIDERSYTDFTCRLYMELLHYMHHTHIGIIVASDDSADKQMYPSLRAYECLKEKLEPVLERSVIQRLASVIENNSVPDPKRINKSGLVELELFLEYVLEAYEEYQEGLYEGLELAICTIYYDTQPKQITKTDACFLVRNISPQKYSKFVKEIEDESQDDYKSEDEYITMKRFRTFCVLNSCLSLKDVHSVYKPGHDSSLSLSSRPKLSKEEALSILGNLTDLQEFKFRTYSASRWKKMIEDLNSLDDPDLHNLIWKMIESEVNYLRSERGK
jgi:hypothetical protein